MTPLARVCLVSGLGLTCLASALRVPQSGSAHGGSYVVQANDTLSAIALRYHSSVGELMRLNGISDPDHLQAGQFLVVPSGAYGTWTAPAGDTDRWADRDRSPQIVPADQTQAATYASSGAGTSYIVAGGDTLSALSSRFGVSMATLAAANGIDRPDLVRIGQRLLIPARTSAGASITPAATLRLAPATSTPLPTTATMTGASTTTIAGGSNLGATSDTSLPGPSASQAAVGALLSSEAQAYGIDPALVKAVAWQESGWQMVVARDGGIGVMQLMPATAAWVGPDLLGRAIDPHNLQDNVQAGVALLASYLRQYGGNVQMALAAYNEGPRNLAHGILSSTAQYIANVLALRASFAQ